MSSLRALSALILGCSFLSMGCTVDMESSPFEGGDLDVPLQEMGIGIQNGLLPACFWDHNVQFALRDLAQKPLDDGSGKLLPFPAVPAACYNVIQDTVECALEPGRTLENPHDGDVYEGVAALAPQWIEKPLDDIDSRERVTGCLLQRLNAFGVHVPIALEGDYDTLYEDPVLNASYPDRESTAQGDLFSSEEVEEQMPAFEAYVCSEKELAETCRGGGLWELNLRICDTLSTLCGMVYLGECSSACVPNGPYWICNGSRNTVRARVQHATCI